MWPNSFMNCAIIVHHSTIIQHSTPPILVHLFSRSTISLGEWNTAGCILWQMNDNWASQSLQNTLMMRNFHGAYATVNKTCIHVDSNSQAGWKWADITTHPFTDMHQAILQDLSCCHAQLWMVGGGSWARASVGLWFYGGQGLLLCRATTKCHGIHLAAASWIRIMQNSIPQASRSGAWIHRLRMYFVWFRPKLVPRTFDFWFVLGRASYLKTLFCYSACYWTDGTVLKTLC